VGAGILRQVATVLAVLALVSASSCSGDEKAEGSATGAPETTAVAPSEAVATVEAEVDPAAWRIRANAECNSMVVYYEAVFRRPGRAKPAQIAAASAETLGDWQASMAELGAPEAARASYEEALGLYGEAIGALDSRERGEAEFEQANGLFSKLGLDVCVDVVNLVRSGEDPDSGPVVIHEEGFSSVSRRWTTSRNKEVAFAYVNGRYRIRVLDAPGNKIWWGWTPWAGSTRSTVRVEVDTVLKNRASGIEIFGVLCLATRQRGYFFGIEPPEQRWSIEKAGRQFELLEEELGEDAIRQRVNHVGGECRGGRKGTRLRLFVNGKVVGTYHDPGGYRNFTAVGLAVYAPEGGLEVLFDNVRATELRSSGRG
jgi:hypothetical protein